MPGFQDVDWDKAFGWLAGRTNGSTLTSDQPLPELPNW
jgi:exodeoxyribonuclease V alpha subunit